MAHMDEVGEQCSKVILEDERDIYFSIKRSDPDGEGSQWRIILTDGDGIWQSELTEDALRDMADGTSYTAQEFVALFKMAFNLTKQSDGTIVKYRLSKRKDGKIEFIWSIYLPKDNKTFRLGSIQVTSLAQTDRQAVYCRMFDSLLSVSEECRDRAEQCNKQSEEERKISKSALQRLERYVTLQEQSEQVLYTNFVAVLNEKKRKIRELQDQCEALRQSLGGTSQSVAPEEEPSATVRKGKAGKNAAKRKTITVSACSAPVKRRPKTKSCEVKYNSDQSDNQTDVDDESQPIHPSTSKHRTHKIISDDDVTDIDEETDVQAAAAVSASSAAAADTLPDNSTASDTPSLTITSTHQLNRSDNMNADDLLVTTQSKTSIRIQSNAPESTKSVRDELDDLLGDSEPSTSHTKSPVKRRAVTRARPPPSARSSRAPAKRSKQDNKDLMEDLLDDL